MQCNKKHKQCFGIKFLMISIVEQCIEIELLMISMVLQCNRTVLAMNWKEIAHDKLSSAMQ